MTLENSIDLDAYFRRIGHDGDRAPTLETLGAIQLRHLQTIPFENLNPLLRLLVPLDAASIQQKLVQERRGGYCYEQNLLLRDVLRALGYRVRGLAARVISNAPPGAIRPQTHMFLLVDLDGASWMADVGFGGSTPTGPLRLERDIEQTTPHGLYRLIQSPIDYILESKIQGDWKPLHRFTLQEQETVDYEVANWYVSTYPSSHFRHNLFVALAAPEGRRLTLRRNQLTTHHPDAESEHRLLATPLEIREALETTFNITPPEVPNLDSILAEQCEPVD